MRKIIFDKKLLDNIDDSEPIFAIKEGKIYGMVLLFNNHGWALSLGGDFLSNSYHLTRKECIKSNIQYGYEFVDKNMVKINVENSLGTICYYNNVDEDAPIFIKKDGKLCGMIIHSKDNFSSYWTMYIPCNDDNNKLYSSREACIRDGLKEGYEFYIEDKCFILKINNCIGENKK